MKTKLMHAGVIIALILFTSFAPSAFAVEGGLGRPISGMQIIPFAGLVYWEPGFVIVTGETYYEGSIGGATQVDIAGLLVANVDVKASIHSNHLALYLAHADQRVELCFGSWLSASLA
jgi:hypothetical protein